MQTSELCGIERVQTEFRGAGFECSFISSIDTVSGIEETLYLWKSINGMIVTLDTRTILVH